MLLLVILFSLLPATVYAADHTLHPNTNTKIRVPIDLEKGAMVILPATPVSVTGKAMPNFQVEVIGEKVMVTPLRVGARTNLFIDLGNSTIATLELVGVAGGGEDLVNLIVREEDSKLRETPLERVSFPTDLKFLAGPWQVRKIGKKSASGGVSLTLHHLLAVNDYLILNFSVTYAGEEAATIDEILVQIQNLGGLGGKTVMESRTVPATVELRDSTLTPGDTPSGTIIIPRLELGFDQVLAVRVGTKKGTGPEVQLTL